MLIVTGGAGFIGSCVVRTLNDAGRDDIIVVDNIASTDKWKNLSNKKYIKYVHKDKFLADELPSLTSQYGGSSHGNVEAIIHLGACSSTMERNFDYLHSNNFEYTKILWDYCAEYDIPFIYASSAATYGDGSHGFNDKADIDALRPLNAYGYSKQLFDQWVEHQAKSFPIQHVGLKFFNVYGPNEYYKGSMASMVFHGFKQIKSEEKIKLFKSYRKEYPDGAQERDFVYVKDVCSVITWFLENGNISGLFNVGTGEARTFGELAHAIFYNLGIKQNIEYIDMPEGLREKYQYHTLAEIGKLREVGYKKEFFTLESGIRDYVMNYLDRDFCTY